MNPDEGANRDIPLRSRFFVVYIVGFVVAFWPVVQVLRVLEVSTALVFGAGLFASTGVDRWHDWLAEWHAAAQEVGA